MSAFHRRVVRVGAPTPVRQGTNNTGDAGLVGFKIAKSYHLYCSRSISSDYLSC